jgi:hypothetical protein
MPVVGLDNELVGHVQEVHKRDFLVNRPRQADILIPLDAVYRVTSDGHVALTVRTRQVDDLGWPKP